MTKDSVLQECTIEGNVLKLPDYQLDRKVYLQVKKDLKLIGGKWKGGKVYGFVFDSDPSELLQTLIAGEYKDPKKEFQFFETPARLADYLVSLADLREHYTVLEPSAGQGAIVKAIHRQFPNMEVLVSEIMETNAKILLAGYKHKNYNVMNTHELFKKHFGNQIAVDLKHPNMESFFEELNEECLQEDKHKKCNDIPNVNLIGDDYLQVNLKPHTEIDRIIANPPFAKNQDIDHVYKMFNDLTPGGRIVTIMSSHFTFAEEKKCKDFRLFLDHVGATVEELDPEAFKESGTMVKAVIVIIDKK